ncbi:hypothetical protein D9611_007177 [Ephemerocybe angulata]|uniref:Nephrocystin 3-like N-terminal domain-containing protein n=1 Tax=Ephemerocybe angulata TaxID=980116 RepID=A0A8H5EWC2_9AGAR|nr:hypothetical protein D9611_007177 [Tulosesus angulatus]
MDRPHKHDRAKNWFKGHLPCFRSRSRSPAPTRPDVSKVHSHQPTARPTATLVGAQDFQAGGVQIEGPAIAPITDELRETGTTSPLSGRGKRANERPDQAPSSTVNPSPNPPQGSVSAEAQTNDNCTVGSLEAGYKPQTLRNKVYQGVKATLRTVVAVTDAFPPLKSTAAALLVICDTIDRYSENPKEFNKLLLRVELLAKTIESCPSPDLRQSLASRFEKMSKDLDMMKRKVEEKTAEDRWKISRAILSEQDKQEISDLTNQISRLIEETMFEVTIKNGSWTLQIIGEIGWMKGQLNTIEDKIDLHTAIMNHVKESLQVQRLLEKLRNVKGAEFSHRSQGSGCIPGSRVALINQLLEWAGDLKSPHLFWLSGLAGTGKTAVSKTFCSLLHEEGRLGGSHFCSLKAADRRDVSSILPALAKILAKAHAGFCCALQTVVDQSDSDPMDMDLSTQYAKLILEPAQEAFANGECVVFCVDALDECHGHESIEEFISAVLSKAPTCHLKFFLTSRPEYSVRQSFKSSTRHGSLRLHEIEGHIVRSDILLYLQAQFKSVDILHEHYKSEWPSSHIQAIADFCGNMFIVASTAFKYITAPNGSCLKRFQDFVQSTSDLKREEIDALYERILTEAFKGLEDDEVKLVQRSLSLLLTAQRPLSVYDYAKLLGVEIWQVRDAFKALHSVVQIPDEGQDDAAISIFHASFSDYVTSERCRAERTRWAVVISVAHSATAGACFSVMDAQLCMGVSGAKTSYKANDEQPEPLSVSTELAYACTTWGEHVMEAGVEHWKSKLREFLSGTAVLHWLEALSVVRDVQYAYTILWRLAKMLGPTELGSLLSDVGDFTHNFHTPISHSAPHLYLSALPCYAAIKKPDQASFPELKGVPKVHHRPLGGPQVLTVNAGRCITSVAFSPDSKTFASADNDGTVRIFNAQTGQVVAGPFKEHMGYVSSVVFSPDGRKIATGCGETVQVWDVQMAQLALDPLTGHTRAVNSVDFSSDGRYIVSGSDDKTVRVWDAQTGQPAFDSSAIQTTAVKSVAFSPSGRYIVFGSSDNTVQVWDTLTHQLALDPFTGHTDQVYSVAFSPDGRKVVSGSDDHTIRVWDAKTGLPVSDPFIGHTNLVRSVAFSPDGTHIVSGSNDWTVRVWGAQTGQPASNPFTGHCTHMVWSAAFSPDGRHVISGSADGTIQVWNIQSGQPASDPRIGHTSAVHSVAFSPDGRCILSGSYNYTVGVWDVQTGQPAVALDSYPLHSEWARGRSLAFSPDGSRVIFGSNDGTIQVWDVQTGQPVLGPLTGHEERVTCVAFSPDGNHIASGSADKTVRVWDARTGNPALNSFKGHTDWIKAVAFSPDGRHIVSGSDDNTAQVWDVQTGQLTLAPFNGRDRSVRSVAFSPEGRHVASGSDGRTIQVWDTQTGQVTVGPFGEHTSWVLSVAFSPDGRYIVSGSEDKTVRVWDAQTGKAALDPFVGHTDAINSVSFSPDGSCVASGSDDKTVRVWKIPQAHEFRESQECVFLHEYPHGCTTIGDDGWLRNTNGDVLMWIPPSFRDGLYICGLQHIIGKVATTKIELQDAICHGERWLRCQDSPLANPTTGRISWPMPCLKVLI